MNKVVTFSRSADYLHQRAMHNRRDGSMLDALDLMRGALERENDNLAYRMDLAELYCEMGCHRQSIRMLLSILAGDEPLGECLFGMCCNYIGLRDYTAAHSLMMWFLALDPESIERPEVAETLALLVQRQMGEMSESRRHRRAQHFAARGRGLLRAHDVEGGIWMLGRALELNPGDQHAAALLAIALGTVGRQESARKWIARALSAEDVAVRTRCIAAQLYAALGEADLARAQFSAIRAMERDQDDQFLLLHAAAQSGADQLVLETANEMLKVLPYDAHVLHAKAVALINLGGEGAAGARNCWERIARLDPTDTVAKFYASACAHGALHGQRLSYDGDVPPDERAARAESVRARLGGSAEAAWADHQFRATVGWMAQSQQEDLFAAALDILCEVDAPEAALMLRSCLLQPGARKEQRERITGYLATRGHRAPYIAPDGLGRLIDAAAPRDGRWTYSPAQRRVLALALRTRASGQGRHGALVEAAWRKFLIRRGDRPPHILRPAAWSAALVAIRLKLEGDAEAIALLARMFGCPGRMISHCARRIQREIQSAKEGPDDETD